MIRRFRSDVAILPAGLLPTLLRPPGQDDQFVPQVELRQDSQRERQGCQDEPLERKRPWGYLEVCLGDRGDIPGHPQDLKAGSSEQCGNGFRREIEAVIGIVEVSR